MFAWIRLDHGKLNDVVLSCLVRAILRCLVLCLFFNMFFSMQEIRAPHASTRLRLSVASVSCYVLALFVCASKFMLMSDVYSYAVAECVMVVCLRKPLWDNCCTLCYLAAKS